MKTILLLSCLLLGSTFAKAQQLHSYIQQAENNNPKIKAFILRYTMATEKVHEANALPDTQIRAGYFVSEPETRTGAQRARFSVQQMLPWFGTIRARENYASARAKTEFVAMVIAKRKLALAVSQSYSQLYALKAKQKVLEGNIGVLKTYEQWALTSVAVGKASVVEVLRLQIRQNELQQQKEMLQEAYIAAQSAFNSLLNRKQTLAIQVALEFEMPKDDPIMVPDSLSLNPELVQYDARYESVAQHELLNRKEGLPKIGFGLDYIPVAELSEVSFNDNGKDILMPRVSVHIPIFNHQYTSRTKQNALRQQEIQQQKNERLNALETALSKAISRRNQARIKYNTQERNLKQAKKAEEILLKNYETGTIDFNDVLDIHELQLKLELNQIDAIQMYYVQSAAINYLRN